MFLYNSYSYSSAVVTVFALVVLGTIIYTVDFYTPFSLQRHRERGVLYESLRLEI